MDTKARKLGGVHSHNPGIYESVKRVVDFTVAGLGLALLAPFLGLVVLLVRRRMGLSAVFRQARIGREAQPFLVYKFRTMTDARGPDGELLPDGERLTGLGRWLRRLSIDELPQLWNVVCGEMSLVGPRPLLPEYIARYTPEQMRRHEALPGITGWAQVRGRNATRWAERFRQDVWYIDHRSLALDLRILGLTVIKVLKREGVSADGYATMPLFKGING